MCAVHVEVAHGGARATPRSTVSGLRENSPPVSAKGERSRRSQRGLDARHRARRRAAGRRSPRCSTGESRVEVGGHGGGAEPALAGHPAGLGHHAALARRRARRRRAPAPGPPRSITGGTSVAKSSAWPTRSTSTAPARRSSRASATRLVHEHARGRRALLPRVAEGRAHDAGHGLVEVGVGVDDHAVLAAHLGHDALHVALALGRLGRRAHDLAGPPRPSP